MKAVTPFLFASDMDGTLFPNGQQVGEEGCVGRTRDLLQHLRKDDCPLAYISGRYLALAQQGLEEYDLPAPDYWVCNVGSEIYDQDGQPDPRWNDLLGPTFNHKQIQAAVADIPLLELQEQIKQGPHKLSFYYPEPADTGLQKRILSAIRRTTTEIKLIHSVEESTGRALIDILPKASGKSSALKYLAARHDFTSNRVFFAGDSGNDIDALMSGVCGTLVGNAPEAVQRETREHLAATPDARVYIADHFYGDGIIEALRYYKLISV